MAFQYNVLTEDQAEELRTKFLILNPGIYPFTVVDSKSKISSSGNQMIELKLAIVADGVTTNVFDFLLSTDNMAWKIRHFCKSTDTMAFYTSGRFDAPYCLGQRGWVELGIKKEQPKNDGSGGVYPAKNIVVDYVDYSAKAAKSLPATKTPPKPSSPPETAPEFNDDIPF